MGRKPGSHLLSKKSQVRISSALGCNPVFPGFSAFGGDGVTRAGIAHIFLAVLIFTHTGLLPMQTFSLSENSCSRFTLCLLLSDCIHLIVSAMFFLLLWPHCHYLQLKKLLRVLNGAGALVSPHMDSKVLI